MEKMAILNYSWTQKSLCTLGYKLVDCAIEKQVDPDTPCRLESCKDYVLFYNPGY